MPSAPSPHNSRNRSTFPAPRSISSVSRVTWAYMSAARYGASGSIDGVQGRELARRRDRTVRFRPVIDNGDPRLVQRSDDRRPARAHRLWWSIRLPHRLMAGLVHLGSRFPQPAHRLGQLRRLHSSYERSSKELGWQPGRSAVRPEGRGFPFKKLWLTGLYGSLPHLLVSARVRNGPGALRFWAIGFFLLLPQSRALPWQHGQLPPPAFPRVHDKHARRSCPDPHHPAFRVSSSN